MNYINLDKLNLSRYEISENGIVRNTKSKRLLKINLKGDLQIVTLHNDNNKSTGYFIHLLVAKIFIPNPNNYKYVMHIDNNNLNNDKSNLQWTNKRQNRNNKPIEKENEDWKDVIGLNDYEVSSSGYIRNKYSKKLLKGHLHGGYIRINIANKKYFLHVLLAKTFLREPIQNETVDHIDRNKTNNNINNLRWASKTIQITNRSITKTNGLKRPIGQYTVNGELIRIWDSIQEAAQYFNTWTATLKHNKISFGFLWKYNDIAYLPNEEFKDISNYYITVYPELERIQVSNMGRIKYTIGRISYGFLNNAGYYVINLKEKTHYVHRLVMYAFNPNLENPNFIVNHIDGNKSNNNVKNLEWCSLKDNIHHAVNVLNKIGKTVYQYSMDNKYLNEYNSIREASRQTNIHKASISACLNGQNKSGGGYKWYYTKISQYTNYIR